MHKPGTTRPRGVTGTRTPGPDESRGGCVVSTLQPHLPHPSFRSTRAWVTLIVSRCHKVTGSATGSAGLDRKRGAARTQPVPAGRSVAHAPLIKPRRNDDPRKCASVFGRIDRSDCHGSASTGAPGTGWISLYLSLSSSSFLSFFSSPSPSVLDRNVFLGWSNRGIRFFENIQRVKARGMLSRWLTGENYDATKTKREWTSS